MIDLPIIVKNKVVLLEDDINILFYGDNKNGDKVISSIMKENQFLAVIVSNIEFKYYLKGDISYRKILDNSDEVYIIYEEDNGRIIDVLETDINSIKKEYLPLKDTYIPKD